MLGLTETSQLASLLFRTATIFPFIICVEKRSLDLGLWSLKNCVESLKEHRCRNQCRKQRSQI